MAERMPPPGAEKKPSLVIAVGVPKRGDGGQRGDDDGRMPPPGTEKPDTGGKATPDDAKVVREDQHCIDCENYGVDTGECEKVTGAFAPQDGCHMYFSPLPEEDNETPEQEAAEPDELSPAATAPGARGGAA